MLVTIDRDGSLEHQAAMMLQLLEYLLEKKPVTVRIFDTSRKTEKYECFILYDDLLAQPPLSNTITEADMPSHSHSIVDPGHIDTR